MHTQNIDKALYEVTVHSTCMINVCTVYTKESRLLMVIMNPMLHQQHTNYTDSCRGDNSRHWRNRQGSAVACHRVTIHCSRNVHSQDVHVGQTI